MASPSLLLQHEITSTLKSSGNSPHPNQLGGLNIISTLCLLLQLDSAFSDIGGYLGNIDGSSLSIGISSASKLGFITG